MFSLRKQYYSTQARFKKLQYHINVVVFIRLENRKTCGRFSTTRITYEFVVTDTTLVSLESWKEDSKFRTLIRTTAYLIIYIFNIMHKEEERKSASLSAENIVQAENYWLQRIQEEAFPTEV